MTPCDESTAPWLVACLCADWCHVCQDYRAAFAAVADEFAAVATFVWVDIEDDEDAMGGIEVDDFPTLLIARGEEVHHFAAVRPSAAAAQALLRRALGGQTELLADQGLSGLAQRLRAPRRAGR